MDLIRLVRVSTGEGVVCVDEKAGLTQQLPQEDSEDEISKVHAESDPPVCWVRESQKTTSQPRDNRAAGNDSVGGAKEETGKRNDVLFLCLKCSSWVSPSSSSNTCSSLSQRHSEHLHSEGPCGTQSWEGAVPSQLAVESSPPQLELPALLNTHCWAVWEVRGFFPTEVSHLSLGSSALWGCCPFFWEQKSLLFLSHLPFLSSAAWEQCLSPMSPKIGDELCRAAAQGFWRSLILVG